MTADGAALFDGRGARKYVCASELRRFLAAADEAPFAERLLCLVLARTGCRISEALALTPARLDHETASVVFRTLKRRRQTFRAVPLPAELIADLAALARGKLLHERLWPFCRQTAWRHVKAVMAEAGIAGHHAMPKGLRHGFGVANAESNIPAHLTQRWMGHARLETTAIYQQAIGSEERAFAERLWRNERHIS
jgi:integrase